MKSMYKYTALLLSALLLLGAVCGCESDSTSTETTEEETVTATAETTVDVSDVDLPIDVGDLFSNRDMESGYDAAAAMAISLTGASAACDASGVTVSGSTVTISEEGVYVLSGTLADGMIVVDADKSDKIQLVLSGVTITSSTSAAIYVKQADKVFVTTVSGTENTLRNGGTYEAIDDNNIDAVIFSKDDLTLNGEGTLIISAAAGHGVVSKDELVITGGTYEITADEHALSGKDDVCIADGTFSLTCGQDAIHSENDDDDTLGFVYIAGGTFDIAAGDDGLHAGYAVVIAGGTIDITQCYEGIEGLSIDILGGEITLVASDDGLNAAGGNDSSGFGGQGESMFAVTDGAYIRISGGSLSVTATGDGIDSNGNLYVSGGTIFISGPTNGGNGALDYNGSAVITGGTVVAVEASTTMAQNFGSSSTQGSMLLGVSGSAEDSVVLYDDAGNELVSWTPGRSFGAVLISAPALTQGNTYTLCVGENETEISLSSLTFTSTASGGMHQSMGGSTGGASGSTKSGGQSMQRQTSPGR